MKSWAKSFLASLVSSRVLRLLGGFALGCLLLVLLLNLRVLFAAQGKTFAQAKQVPQAGVAIILGAAVSGKTPSDILEDRLTAGLELYKSGKVEKLLVTGDNGSRNYNEVRAMQDWLVRHGVPRVDVVQDHAGFRTFDSLYRAVHVFRVPSAVICTQEFHLARSLYLAEQLGLPAVGLEADKRLYRAQMMNQLREILARAIAVFDLHLWHRRPRFSGPAEPIRLSSAGAVSPRAQP